MEREGTDPPPVTDTVQERLTLSQLRTFCELARLGTNMTQAAERLKRTQPWVSAQMRQLEAAVGARLLERRRQGLVPTALGRRLQHLAAPLVEGVDTLADRFTEEHHGVAAHALRVGASDDCAVHVLPAYLKRLRERHPELHAAVRVAANPQSLERLRAGEVDLAACAIDTAPTDVDVHPICESELVLITPEAHPLARCDAIAPHEAAEYPFVAHASGHEAREAWEPALRWRYGVEVEIAVEVDGWGAVAHHVAAGAGVAIVPDACLDGATAVHTVRLNGALPPRRYAVLTRRRRALSLPARRFLDVVAAGAGGA